ncbi:glycoside hydrolase family 10 protein [Lutimonas zeaxanthinifaciens]|uniref:glycoside hydrolase family 10 protein n=1 Tax=Lutimonas zeaxanthinifaciens TaxID=3060215 RepID=UPI00265D2777|nr:family 10 glycosylhydrolase [Lutimonas sp. YSD2104]WKK64955.1 family 10 glycosylhydrolase [Lutimonas sp. YSD2104]
MNQLRSIPFVLLILFSMLRVNAQDLPKREFRGVWVATVGNIDWPSNRNLTSEQQKNEIINLLDLFKKLNFNAIIFQIRPSADAFYNSKYEPWSYYLNGENNKPPNPYYDPLAFIIEEAHKRGMEFHAWLNPYRAVVNYQEYRSNPFPLTYEKPEWFINYGKNKYFDPGIPEVRTYTTGIVTDIVQNYDIDAIHFDDYFYPYKIHDQVFDDARSFASHGGNFFPENRDDWRRENVNYIIRDLYHTIKDLKPWVQFGISPFGVWRNQEDDQRGSETLAGQTNYDDLFADILYWMKNGWVDYILPQAYWHIGHEKVSYDKVINWWSDNSFGTKLYIGHGMYKLGDNNEPLAWNKKSPTEIEKQLELNHSLSNIDGSVFFSAKSFISNTYNINTALTDRFYTHPSLQPVANKSEKFTPQPVSNARISKVRNKQYLLSWDVIPENQSYQAVKFLVYKFKKDETHNLNKTANIIALTGATQIEIAKKDVNPGESLIIVSVSRNNNLGSPVTVRF